MVVDFFYICFLPFFVLFFFFYIDSVKINVFSLFSLGRGFFAGGLYFADCMLKGTHQGKVAIASLIVFMRATFTN